MLLGLLIFLGSGIILSLYNISSDARNYAQFVLTIMACVLWVKSSNIMVLVGVLRSGGDTRFALLLDAGSIWLVGVPLVLIGAFVLHLPFQGVYLLVLADELIRFVIGLYRFTSKRWINNLTQVAAGL